jgi:hypothetical protein
MQIYLLYTHHNQLTILFAIVAQILSYRVMQQQQQQTKKSLLSKSNVNNDHRMKIESNSTTLSLKPMKYDRLSNANMTSIR